MKVHELIEQLKNMPQDAPVGYVYDGAMRGSAEIVYLAQNGSVGIANDGDYIYDEEEKPIGAPKNRSEIDSCDLSRFFGRDY